MINWLRHSGITVIIIANPMQWSWRPYARDFDVNEWRGPNERAWVAAWLFLRINLFVDDGRW